MKDISLEQYNLFKFGSLTGKKTVAEEVKEVAENIDICKDVEEVKQFLENSNINKTKSIFRELTDEQVEELMRAEEEDFNFVSEANEIAEETITATESKTLTPDNSPMTLEPNKTYNVKLTYGNHTYNYDVTTGTAAVEIKYFTTDGALGITGDNVKVKPSSDNEKNNIRFDGSNNKLDLSTAGTTNIINNIRYYKTFEGGSSISKDEDTPLANLTLERGQAEKSLTLTTQEKIVLLTNPYTGENYTYKVSFDAERAAQAKTDGFTNTNITSTSLTFKFLTNGRLVITGNYAKITAGDNQVDDLILKGSYNEVNTGDLDDIVRVGYVVGSSDVYDADIDTGKHWGYKNVGKGLGDYNYNSSTKKYEYVGENQGSYIRTYKTTGNKINTGAGNDYISHKSYGNTFDMGEGNADKIIGDTSYDYSSSYSTVINAESRTYKTSYASATVANLNGLDGWGRQGSLGICAILSIINSIGHCTGQTNLNDYITVEPYTYVDETDGKTKQAYNVTFDKFNTNYASKDENLIGTVSVTQAEINSYKGVYGDPDTRLFAKALDKILTENFKDYDCTGWESAMDIIRTASDKKYNWENLASQYIFGTVNKHWYYLKSSTKTDFIDHWKLYDAGKIPSMIISIFDGNKYETSRISSHAYAINYVDYSHESDNDNYVELVNPWDDGDRLRVSFTEFFSWSKSYVTICAKSKSQLTTLVNNYNAQNPSANDENIDENFDEEDLLEETEDRPIPNNIFAYNDIIEELENEELI